MFGSIQELQHDHERYRIGPTKWANGARHRCDRGYRRRGCKRANFPRLGVLGLNRTPDEARRRASWVRPVEWIPGDSMKETDVIAAAAGVDLIFHGANPPGYRNWRELAIPMLCNTIIAARHSGARIVIPGNVYNFGPDAGSVVNENSPQQPSTRKGKIRVEMEQLLRAASQEGSGQSSFARVTSSVRTSPPRGSRMRWSSRESRCARLFIPETFRQATLGHIFPIWLKPLQD
jgi:hypothetical protein